MSSSGKCKAKAAAFSCSTCTLYPDVSMHRFHELFTDVESQATPSRRPSKVTLEPHKFAKEQVRQHDNTEAHLGGQVDAENGQSFVKAHASFLFLFQRIVP
jgi:hypothetical protein